MGKMKYAGILGHQYPSDESCQNLSRLSALEKYVCAQNLHVRIAGRSISTFEQYSFPNVHIGVSPLWSNNEYPIPSRELSSDESSQVGVTLCKRRWQQFLMKLGTSGALDEKLLERTRNKGRFLEQRWPNILSWKVQVLPLHGHHSESTLLRNQHKYYTSD